MKRFLFAGLALVLCLSLGSCAGNKPAEQSEKPTVVASVFPLYDFARVICKDRCRVELLLKAGTSAHAYEPTPQDLVLLSECGLFLYVGGESDEALETMLASTEKVRALKLLNAIEPIEEEEDPGHMDEHIWTSPKCAVQIVCAITDELCALFPEHASVFIENRDAYLISLKDLDAQFESFADKNHTLIFADRFPFSYLCRDYGIRYVAASKGCGEENWPSASKLSELIRLVREENIPAVFYTELAGKSYAENIQAETGCKIAYLHACHNLTRAEADENLDYLTLMYRNSDTLNAMFPS